MSDLKARTKQLRLQDLASAINAAHDNVMAGLRATLEQAIDTGCLLTEAKGPMKRGTWWQWIADHCAFSYRMAQVYMRLHKHREIVRRTPADTIQEALHAIHDFYNAPGYVVPELGKVVSPKPWTDHSGEITERPSKAQSVALYCGMRTKWNLDGFAEYIVYIMEERGFTEKQLLTEIHRRTKR